MHSRRIIMRDLKPANCLYLKQKALIPSSNPKRALFRALIPSSNPSFNPSTAPKTWSKCLSVHHGQSLRVFVLGQAYLSLGNKLVVRADPNHFIVASSHNCIRNRNFNLNPYQSIMACLELTEVFSPPHSRPPNGRTALCLLTSGSANSAWKSTSGNQCQLVQLGLGCKSANPSPNLTPTLPLLGSGFSAPPNLGTTRRPTQPLNMTLKQGSRRGLLAGRP